MRSDGDIARDIAQRSSVQTLLEELTRSIIDAVTMEVDIHDEDGNELAGEDDLMVTRMVHAGEASYVCRCVSLKQLLQEFVNDDFNRELNFFRNMRRVRAIGEHALALAAQMEAEVREDGVVEGEEHQREEA